MSEEIQRLHAKKKQIGKTLTCQNCFHGVDPPEWVGLTKKEIESISDRVKPDPLMTEEPTWHIRFAQALQRKLKEKNTELLS